MGNFTRVSNTEVNNEYYVGTSTDTLPTTARVGAKAFFTDPPYLIKRFNGEDWIFIGRNGVESTDTSFGTGLSSISLPFSDVSTRVKYTFTVGAGLTQISILAFPHATTGVEADCCLGFCINAASDVEANTILNSSNSYVFPNATYHWPLYYARYNIPIDRLRITNINNPIIRLDIATMASSGTQATTTSGLIILQ